MCKSIEDVTYELFNIEPNTFYEKKFLGGEAANYMSSHLNLYDIEMSRLRFLIEHIKEGMTVLDIGCGSGPFGKTLKEYCKVDRLVGVDMSQECVEMSLLCGYDETKCFEVSSNIPYDDSEFDCVISVDFFGHIEFRHKNKIINEIHWVTKPGGISLHVIESGEVDYLSCDPKDENDEIKQYVHQDGHVGIENTHELRKRWEQYFDKLNIENAFIHPIYPINTYKFSHLKEVDSTLLNIIKGFSDKEIIACQVLMGFIDHYFKGLLRKYNSEILDTSIEVTDNSYGSFIG